MTSNSQNDKFLDGTVHMIFAYDVQHQQMRIKINKYDGGKDQDIPTQKSSDTLQIRYSFTA